jgi:hypothetical protein
VLLLPLLQVGVLDLAEVLSEESLNAHPAARRLAHTLQALLGLTSQLQDGMGAERSHGHKQAVSACLGRLAGAPAVRRS